MLTDMIGNDFVSIFVHWSTFKKNTINGRLQKLKPLKKEALGMWDNEGEPHRTFGQRLWAAPVGNVAMGDLLLGKGSYFDDNGAWNSLDSVLIFNIWVFVLCVPLSSDNSVALLHRAKNNDMEENVPCQMTFNSTNNLFLSPGSLLTDSPFPFRISTLMAPAKEAQR